jgi:hypothetical protein
MIEGQRAEFDRLWPMLKEAVHRYGETHDKEHVWARIEAGYAQFWALPNSALVTEIQTYETGLREIRGWLAAGDIHEIKAFIPHLEAWGRMAVARERQSLAGAGGFGLLTIIGMSRRSWSRSFRNGQK